MVSLGHPSMGEKSTDWRKSSREPQGCTGSMFKVFKQRLKVFSASSEGSRDCKAVWSIFD